MLRTENRIDLALTLHQPLPIMNIVFGGLVGEFSSYFTPGTTTTEAHFKAAVSRLR